MTCQVSHKHVYTDHDIHVHKLDLANLGFKL